MKIPLKISPENLIVVDTFVRAPRYHGVFGNITFIVDTGSAESLISEADALKIRIPIKSLPQKKGMGRGLTGGAIKLRTMKDVTISFKTEDNKIEKIKISGIDIGLSAKRDEKSIIRDSIIGNNFLLQNKLKLIFSPFEKIAYLEKIS
ncbi:MAG: hypothetical protein ACTSP3_06090 [Candidatus Heimdallarchaeaceae archaeon]